MQKKLTAHPKASTSFWKLNELISTQPSKNSLKLFVEDIHMPKLQMKRFKVLKNYAAMFKK
jgi:hypothetical protein